MPNIPVVLVSSCLLGLNCRYDGSGQFCPGVINRMDRFHFIPVCPEQLGGLPTPRVPAERKGKQIISADGVDMTDHFKHGADQVCRLAKLFDVHLAVLKARSPSCGSKEIYDGSFSGVLTVGQGLTAESLDTLGVQILTEEELDKLDVLFPPYN